MSWAPIRLRPGVVSNGTDYQNKRVYTSSDLVRWHMNKLQPIGGWSQISVGTVTGSARGIHTWSDDTEVSRAAVGTEQGLWLMSDAGALTEVTPSGFATQDADASDWTLDNAGETLLALCSEDGTVYKWEPGDMDAAALTNAPTGTALFVTEQNMPVVLGENSDPRSIRWCDPDDITNWTETFSNLSGQLTIQSTGGLMQGVNVRGGSLLLTDEDAHLMRFVQRPDVYGVSRIAGNCGAVSRGAAVSNQSWAMWMGKDNFYRYNGFVEAIDCDVWDEVFPNLTEAQRSKVRAVHVERFKEIWWHVPTSTENDLVVVFNYDLGIWFTHSMARLCAAPRGNGFDYPLMVDASGAVFEHEKGNTMSGAGTPKARTAFFEVGSGEKIAHLDRIVPDEETAGDVRVKIYARSMPNATERTFGPYTAANPIQVRIAARQLAMEFEQVNATDWRVGEFRASLKAGGKR